MRGFSKRVQRKQRRTGSADTLTCELPPDLSTLSRGDIIAQYHEIKKKLAVVDKSPQIPNEASRQALRQVFRAQLALIGIQKYQQASREGEVLGGGFDSSLWVVKELPVYCSRLGKIKSPISLLDVGAISRRFPNVLGIPNHLCAGDEGLGTRRVALNVTSIDLNPEDSEAGKTVIKADFFDFARQKLSENSEKYDVVCLSLCVNFEGCAKRRGQMIHLASRLLRSGGLLFLVLPRACVQNSRYLDEERYRGILNATDMGVLSMTYTTKLMKSISEKREAGEEVDRRVWAPFARKEILRQGQDRNNFAICLDSALLHENSYGAEEEGERPVRASGLQKGRTKADIASTKKNKRKRGTNGAESSSGVKKHRLTSNQRKRARRKAMRIQKSAAADKGTEGSR